MEYIGFDKDRMEERKTELSEAIAEMCEKIADSENISVSKVVYNIERYIQKYEQLETHYISFQKLMLADHYMDICAGVYSPDEIKMGDIYVLADIEEVDYVIKDSIYEVLK